MNRQDLEIAIDSVTNNMKEAHKASMHAEAFRYLHQLMELEDLRAKMLFLELNPPAKVVYLSQWKASRQRPVS